MEKMNVIIDGRLNEELINEVKIKYLKDGVAVGDLSRHFEEVIRHKVIVDGLIKSVCRELELRADIHDDTKFSKEECYILSENPIKAETGIGSKEYEEGLNKVREALNHHYKSERHHPEHFDNGICGMDLVDLIEMLCDWMSYALLSGRDIKSTLDYTRKRFEISDELESILVNTAESMLKEGRWYERSNNDK